MRIADELDIFGQKRIYFPLAGVEFQARKGVRHTGKLEPSLRFVVAIREGRRPPFAIEIALGYKV
jgi:hypothetical protein